MPFSGITDERLPDKVRKMSRKRREAFVKAFNAAFAFYKGDEGKAYGTAWQAAQSVSEADEETSVDKNETADRVIEATDEDRQAQEKRAKGGIKPVEGKPITKPKQWENVSDEDFLDMTNYAYPVHDVMHRLAALRYFNHGGQRAKGGYSPEEWAKMGKKLAAKLGDGYAYDPESETVVKENAESFSNDAARLSFYRTLEVIPDLPDDVGRIVLEATLMVTEVGRRHSAGDIALIDQCIAMLTELRGMEAEPGHHGESEEEPEAEVEAAQMPDMPAAKDKKGPLAYCPKCGKKMPMMDAKEKTVAGRKMMTGKCENGHSMSTFQGAQESARPEYVSEIIPLTESDAQIDEGAHEVQVTIIRPGWSQNQRYYSPDVLKEAAPLFEGIKAFADHPGESDAKNRPERSVRDVVGYYPKAWLDEATGAVKGKLKVVGDAERWLWPLIVETVRNKAGLVSTSINALGRIKPGEAEGKKGNVVEGIVKANSTDVVTQAAAGGQFDRLLASDGGFTDGLLSAMSYDQWVESRPDFCVRLKDEMKTARKDELQEAAGQETAGLKLKIGEVEAKLAEADAERLSLKDGNETLNEKLRGEVQAVREAAAKDLADERQQWQAREAGLVADMHIARSNLPDMARAEVRQAILGKTDEEADAIIEAKRSGLRTAILEAGKPPVQGAGPAPIAAPGAQANIVARMLGVGMTPLPGERAEEFVRRARGG